MSQAPRKFSDKIAMILNKQNEEAEQFRAVMNDVRPITSSTTPGKSPNSTPSSTPYACSPTGTNSNIVTTPSTESPLNGHIDHLQPHPLSMAWQRPGGSLPNVHQMLQQPQQAMGAMPTPEAYSNWMYWQQQQNSHTGSYGHVRTRSPGAQHYHPYKTGQRNERVPPLEHHMMPTSMHLQPPDPSWSNSRARSDPAIHMNTMNNVPMSMYNQPGPQWQPDMRMNGYQQPIPNMPSPTHHQQQASPSMPSTPTGMNSQSVIPNQPHPQNYYGPGSAGSMQMSMSPPAYPMPNGQSPCSPDQIPCGSLPNMHSPINSPLMQPQQQQMNSQQQQQMIRQQPQKPLQQQFSYDQCQQQQQMYPPPYPIQNGQLATPQCQGTESSQSAPTSPAQAYEQSMRPQWPSTRHFSASPDTMDIPNIVLTGADGTLDCFQDLRLDNEMAQLLNTGDQIDPLSETQLLN